MSGCECHFYFILYDENIFFLMQGFKENKEAKTKFFNPMCNFGEQAEWRRRDRDVSLYLDVDTKKDKYRLLDPAPLDCITGYIVVGAVGDTDLKNMPHKSLELVVVSISSYCYIIKSPKRLDMTNKANKFTAVLGDIELYRLGSEEKRKNRALDAKNHRDKKSGQKNKMGDE